MGWGYDPKTETTGTEPETDDAPDDTLTRGTSPGDLLERLAPGAPAPAPAPTPEDEAPATEAAPEPPVPVREHKRRAPRSDKGKPRQPREAAPAVPAHVPGDVLAQVLERIRGAQVAILGAEDGGDLNRAHLLLEEALVIGEGRDVVEWLRGKVFGDGSAGGAR